MGSSILVVGADVATSFGDVSFPASLRFAGAVDLDLPTSEGLVVAG